VSNLHAFSASPNHILVRKYKHRFFRKDSKIKLKRRVWTWLTTFGFDLVQLTGHAGPNKVLVAFSRASEPSCSGNRCAALEGNDGGNTAHSSV